MIFEWAHLVAKDDDAKARAHNNLLWGKALQLFEDCVDASHGVGYTGLESGIMIWNNQTVETLTDALKEQVLWELAELNFRFELLALDSRANGDRCERQNLVAECFPGCTTATLLVTDLSMANHGLADENWEERAHYLQALKRLMKTW